MTKSTKIYLTIIGLITTILVLVFWFTNPPLIIYPFILGSLISYLVVRVEKYKSNDTPEGFFLYNREMPKKSFVPTFVTSNIGLFSSIAFSTILAYYYGISGMVILVAVWFLGMYLFSRAIPKLLPFMKEGNTIHEFIANRYGKTIAQKTSLRVWTSIISSILYFASVGVEIKFGADIFSSSLGNFESVALAFLIATIGIIYSYISGFKGVVSTDKIQFYLMFIMSFVIIIFSIVLIVDNPFSLPSDYFSFPNIILSPDPFGLISLIVLITLYQFCVMDMWQRCIALVKTKDKDGTSYSDEQIIRILKKSTFKRSIMPFAWFFGVWFLIGIVALGTNLTSDLNAILPAFLGAFDSFGSWGFLLKGIVLAGFVAAVISTVDTFLISTVQTIMYDIYGTKFVPGLTEKLGTLPDIKKYRFVSYSRILIPIIGVSAVAFAFTQFELLSFWTSMYSIMLAFFPAVYIGIIGKSQQYKYSFTKASILIGSLGALSLGIIGVWIFPNPNIVSSAPIFAVVVSSIIMLIGKK